MVPVSAIRKATGIIEVTRYREPEVQQTAKTQTPENRTSRTVVAIHSSPNNNLSRDSYRRPLANYLAHLIATDQRLPQTRERRREEPEIATAVYSATARLAQPTLSRKRSVKI